MTIRTDQNAVADIENARTMGQDALTIPTNRVSFSFRAYGRRPHQTFAGNAASSVTSQGSAHTWSVHKDGGNVYRG